VIAALLRRDPSTRPSASAAARMFAQALPQLAESTEKPVPMAHPPTVRSAYVPAPAAPVVSSSLTAPDARQTGKPSAAADEPPEAQAPAAGEPTQEAPESSSAVDEADEAALAVALDADGEDVSAEADDPADEAGSDADAEGESEDEPTPAAEAEAAPETEAEPEEQDEDEATPAAETTRIKVPVAEAAETPVPEAALADATVEPKAAAAVLEAPPGEEAGSRAADTVVPGKGAARYQSSAVPVPVARMAASAPVQPPSTATPAPPEQKTVPPKPTFTAAKPANRVVPTFSAASPPRSATPGRPTPPRSGTPGYPPPGGRTTAFPPSAAHYAPPAGPQGVQYAGPAQAYQDLSRQYTPGSGGGRAWRGLKNRKWQLFWLVVAVAIAIAIGVGTALAMTSSNGGSTGAGGSPTTVPSVPDTPTSFQSVNALNNPSTALPASDWSTKTVTSADAGSSAAGFSIDVPPGWTETSNELATDFNGPGNQLLEVDLTEQPTANMLSAASQVAAASHFRDYSQVALTAVPVRNAEGAVWKFSWTPTAGGAQWTADDIFFAQSTPAGVQDYAVYVRSPSGTFASSLPLFDEMLRTFQTVPAS
jgi:hypothetical protein